MNGDGLGRGTHVSVFLVVCRGDYENLLDYPFCGHIEMQVVNLDGPSKSLQKRMYVKKQSQTAILAAT